MLNAGQLTSFFKKWWLPLLFCVVLPTAVVGNVIQRHSQFSPIDEGAHFDYVERLYSHGIPVLGDRLLPSTLKEIACRGTALPGIVTGIALNNVFTNFFGGLTFFTIIIGHATFCVVVVFNNVAARYRRMGATFEEASMDLGANRLTTFRLVTFPMIRNALVAGALLSFGLSFDEIIVTTFTAGAGQTTLPIWIFQNLFRPNQAPIVNVVAAALIVVSIVPIYLSQRLTQERK